MQNRSIARRDPFSITDGTAALWENNGAIATHTFVDNSAPVSRVFQNLETRLAKSDDEIQAAQRLRFNVFYKEMSATADALTLLNGRDEDKYDRICDHLVVLDNAFSKSDRIVATCRLLRQQVANDNGGFYSLGEFDLEPLLQKHRDLEFLELGRSCVSRSHRSKRTMGLLWQGSWSYVQRHGVDVMIGCASLEGVHPENLAMELSFLHHFARAPELWRVKAVGGQGHSMNRIKKQEINSRTALRSLPPLIKGYLRLGAWIGEEAVIDHQFGTTDVLIILPVANIARRYREHYSNPERHVD